ncbi:MAG: hypothetical protein AB2A00_09820 [Myxococcota bacterium]
MSAVLLGVAAFVCSSCTDGRTSDPTPASTANGGSSSSSSSSGESGSAFSNASSSGVSSSGPNPHDPANATRDSDCDGLTDEEELNRHYAGGASTDPTNPDSDGDGVLDGVEVGASGVVNGRVPACATFPGDVDPNTRTNPTLADSDVDGVPDGAEDKDRNGRVDGGETDPNDPDSDADGLREGQEDVDADGQVDVGETNGTLRDTDGDGIPDGVEDANRNGAREPSETDPRRADTDGDGLVDGEEDLNWNHVIDTGETDPLVPDVDRDGDGMVDTHEILVGLDPDDNDMDDDGLSDGEEDRNRNGHVDPWETDPRRADSDCDGLLDSEEDLDHDGQQGPGETSPLARDTDGDLLPDGMERGVTVNPDPVGCPSFTPDSDPRTTTNPVRSDTDADGINDGIEDVDHDGSRWEAETDPQDADTDGDTLPDGDEDTNANHVVDLGETDPLVPDVDSDGDALSDPVEARLGTNPGNPDSDADGRQDGAEDVNHDGIRSPGETDPLHGDSDCDGLNDGEEDARGTHPLDDDTDDDGITDGIELGRTSSACASFQPAAQPPTVTNPASPDSDGDGIPDGVEDADHNGHQDPGELNPAVADADGPIGDACTTAALAPITLHQAATLQLATLAAFGQRADITVSDVVVGEVLVNAAPEAPVVLLAFTREVRADEPTASAIASHVEQELQPMGLANPITQALPCANPPLDCTWDGFPAVLGSHDLHSGADAFDAANELVTRLLPGAAPPLMGALGQTGPFKLRTEVVRRSNGEAVILLALMPLQAYGVVGGRGVHLDDVSNATALGQRDDDVAVQCDVFQTQAYPKADILFIIDNSASMGDDQQALMMAADAMVALLQNALLDWRVGRITTDSDSPRDLFQNPIPLGYGDTNGTAEASNHHWPFIKPTNEVPFDVVATIIRERHMTPGLTGWGMEASLEPLRYVLQDNPDVAHRLLPATAPGTPEDPWKLRADARLAVVIVSDAGEQSNLPPRTRLDWTEGTEGTILRFLRGGPTNGTALSGTPNAATYDPSRDDEPPILLGGVLCPLGVYCTGEEWGTGNSALLATYHNTVNALGGVVGSIRQPDAIAPAVQAFMSSVIGSVSPYRLTRAAISASLKVAVEGQPQTGCNWADVPRSRQDGFDYDAATGQITFHGACRPSNDAGSVGQRIAVSYRYWVHGEPEPEPDPEPCGGPCDPPLACNPTMNLCECPADCGLSSGCPSPHVCDTNVDVCSCTCPADCGGAPPDPRLVCDPQRCAFVCPADCGGESPGTGYECNPVTCRWECAGCDPAQRPTTSGERYDCDLTTCQWFCPEDCGVPSPGPGYRCDRQTCEYACTPDCGGTCYGYQQCDPRDCACECVEIVTCGAGMKFDPVACDCVCDVDALECDDMRQVDPETCSCACRADCGGACPVGTRCNASLCGCVKDG